MRFVKGSFGISNKFNPGQAALLEVVLSRLTNYTICLALFVQIYHRYCAGHLILFSFRYIKGK